MTKPISVVCLAVSFMCYSAEPIKFQDKKLKIGSNPGVMSDEQILEKMYDAQLDNAQLLTLVRQYPLLRQARLPDNVAILKFVHSKNVPDFLAAGVPLNQANNKGRTALMQLARCGFVERAQTLLEHKADIGKVDDAGCDALLYALENNHGGQIAELLLQHPSFPSIVNRSVSKLNGQKTTYLQEALKKDYTWYLYHDRIVTTLLQHAAAVGVEELSHAAAKNNKTLYEIVSYCPRAILIAFEKDEARKKLLQPSDLETICAHIQASDPELQKILNEHILSPWADSVCEYIGLQKKKIHGPIPCS